MVILTDVTTFPRKLIYCYISLVSERQLQDNYLYLYYTPGGGGGAGGHRKGTGTRKMQEPDGEEEATVRNNHIHCPSQLYLILINKSNINSFTDV